MLTQPLRRAPKVLDPLTRGWAVLVASGALRLALGFVASVLIARALGPDGYGVYAVLAATVGVVGALAEGGLTDPAVQRIAASGPIEGARDRAWGFFWLRLAFAAAMVGGVALLATTFGALVVGNAASGWPLQLALVGIVATALGGAVSAMLQATGRFGRMSLVTLANAALTVVLALALTVAGQLTLLAALLVLGIGTSLASFAVGLRLLPTGWGLRWPGLPAIRTEGRALRPLAGWLWVANLCAMLAATLDVLVLNRRGDLASVGAYALALSLATRLDVVNSSLYTVLLPATATLDQPGAVRHYLRRGLLRSTLIAVALLPTIPLAGPFIALFYGPQFEAAAGLFRILLVAVILDVFATPVLLLPLAYRRPRVIATADGLRALTIGTVASALVPGYGASGAAVARVAARVVGLAVVLVALRAHGRRSRSST